MFYHFRNLLFFNHCSPISPFPCSDVLCWCKHMFTLGSARDVNASKHLYLQQPVTRFFLHLILVCLVCMCSEQDWIPWFSCESLSHSIALRWTLAPKQMSILITLSPTLFHSSFSGILISSSVFLRKTHSIISKRFFLKHNKSRFHIKLAHRNTA